MKTASNPEEILGKLEQLQANEAWSTGSELHIARLLGELGMCDVLDEQH